MTDWKEIAKHFNHLDLLKLEAAYSVQLFGKRGRYDESGDRFYYHKRAEMQQALSEIIEYIKQQGRTIRNVRSWRDDDIETGYSRAYETECYGCRRDYVSIFDSENVEYCWHIRWWSRYKEENNLKQILQ